MNVAIILPARLKSTRLPDKLLLEAGGKTILEHTIDRAREAQAASKGLITRILVAADDEKLIAAAKRAGAEAVMTDPNHTSGTDRVAEAARPIPEDVIVNLQADEPEIDPQSVLLAAKLLTASGDSAPMSTLAVPIFDEDEWRKPNIVKVIVTSSGDALYFSRASVPHIRDANDAAPWKIDARRVYGLHHLGLYAYRKAFLLGYKLLPESKLEKLEKLEQLRALEAGHKIKVGIVKSNPPGIDTPADYAAFSERILNLSPGTIAVLEDNQERTAEMRRLLNANVSHLAAKFFATAPAMIDWLTANLRAVRVVSLDHDLDLPADQRDSGLNPGDGRDVAKFLSAQCPNCPIIIHTSNGIAATSMRLDLEEKGWQCIRVVPFNDLQWIGGFWINEIQNALRAKTQDSALRTQD